MNDIFRLDKVGNQAVTIYLTSGLSIWGYVDLIDSPSGSILIRQVAPDAAGQSRNHPEVIRTNIEFVTHWSTND